MGEKNLLRRNKVHKSDTRLYFFFFFLTLLFVISESYSRELTLGEAK